MPSLALDAPSSLNVDVPVPAQSPSATAPATVDDKGVTVPPPWFEAMSEPHQKGVLWVDVAKLVEHEACAFVPFREAAYAIVLKSVKEFGVLYPLATVQSQVLDGRYRLRAARELGLEKLPTLAVEVSDPAGFAYEMKAAREHMPDLERAAFAVLYQDYKTAAYKRERAAKMNAARTAKNAAGAKADLPLPAVSAPQTADTPAEPHVPPAPAPKLDARKEACEAFKVSERNFRKMRRLANRRPDLFKQVKSGKLTAPMALKQMGKNGQNARATTAKEMLVREQDVANPAIENNVHEGDATEVLKRVADAVASLVLFSPPYYGVKEIVYEPPLPELSYDEYLQQLRAVLTESYCVSRAGGRLAIVLDTPRNREGDRHFMIPVVADVTKLAIDVGWDFWNDIAWCKDEVSGKKTAFGSMGLCSAPMLSRNHETILLFYRDTHKLEGDTTLCDLTRDDHMAWWTSAWKIKPEVRKAIRDIHPAPFPEALVERLVKLFTFRRDLVIDPFNGSGTTTAVAKRLGRRFVGIDRSALYCSKARARLADLTADATPGSPRSHADPVPGMPSALPINECVAAAEGSDNNAISAPA